MPLFVFDSKVVSYKYDVVFLYKYIVHMPFKNNKKYWIYLKLNWQCSWLEKLIALIFVYTVWYNLKIHKLLYWTELIFYVMITRIVFGADFNRFVPGDLNLSQRGSSFTYTPTFYCIPLFTPLHLSYSQLELSAARSF